MHVDGNTDESRMFCNLRVRHIMHILSSFTTILSTSIYIQKSSRQPQKGFQTPKIGQ